MGTSMPKINLIQSVSSLYIIKNIFSLLSEKKKLKLINYNKNYHKKLDIDINDFKRVSGKHLIVEKNGKGKEYDNENRLLFEGEYFKQKKNGKGKEYDTEGRLIFEGEYSNGEKKEKENNFITMVH